MKKKATIILVALTSLLLEGSHARAQPGLMTRAGARRAPARRFHVQYTLTERHGPLLVRHEIHAHDNGFIRYARVVGLGQPFEYTPPSDPDFVTSLKEDLAEAQAASFVRAPCGAPQGGILLVEGPTIQRRRFALSEPEHWERYGRLARRMLAKVVRRPFVSLDSDCQPITLKLSIGPRSKPADSEVVHTRDQEGRFLSMYGAAADDESRTKALYALSFTRDGDPFFRFELLRRFPTSPEALRLVEYHTSSLIRGVSSMDEARLLLERLGRRKGPEFDYHRALLQAAMGDLAAAKRSMISFHRSLAQDRTAARYTAWMTRVEQGHKLVVSGKGTWRNVKTAHARLFEFYLKAVRSVFRGEPKDAPPFALLLLRKAVHHARLAFFSTGPLVLGRLRREAQSILAAFYPALAHGSWLRHPVWHRFDLLSLTSYLRRHRQIPGKEKSGARGLEDIPASTRHLIRLARLKEAERFVSKYGGADPKEESRLRVIQGKTLIGMERYEAGFEALTKAARIGAVEAVAELLRAHVAQGDLSAASRMMEQFPTFVRTAPIRMAQALLERRKGNWEAAERLASEAMARGGGAEAYRARALALSALGRTKEAAELLLSAEKDPGCGCKARAEASELYFRLGDLDSSQEKAYGLARSGFCSPGTGYAIMASVAHRRKQPGLQRLLASRAEFHAGTDPEALVEAARYLMMGRVEPERASRMLEKALMRRPGWSVPHALLARLLAEGGAVKEAFDHLRVALNRRPMDPSYLSLHRALIRLEATGRKR